MFSKRGLSVLAMTVFIDIIFATMGMALFRGNMHYRCHSKPFPVSPHYADWPAENTADGTPLGTYSGLCSPAAEVGRALSSCGAEHYCESALQVNRSFSQSQFVWRNCANSFRRAYWAIRFLRDCANEFSEGRRDQVREDSPRHKAAPEKEAPVHLSPLCDLHLRGQ